jgi:hypothetical protein
VAVRKNILKSKGCVALSGAFPEVLSPESTSEVGMLVIFLTVDRLHILSHIACLKVFFIFFGVAKFMLF